MAPLGGTYFPWIGQFDGIGNDTVVPTWSAALPDSAFDSSVNDIHTNLEANSQSEQDVLGYLNNDSLPLGSAERAAADAADPAGQTGWNAPVNDQNAYAGGVNSGPGTEVSQAGLNPDAIVGVAFGAAGMPQTVTWNAYGDAGIHHPILTGMVQKAAVTAGVNISLIAADYPGSQNNDTLDANIVKYGDAGVYIDPNAWAAAASTDYVPFEISSLAMGRGLTQGVTGPALGGVQSDSAYGYAVIGYTLGALSSPYTMVNLPVYTPPAPVVDSDVTGAGGEIQLTLDGAFQVTDATNSNNNPFNLKIYDTSGDLLWQNIGETLPLPAGVWNGLALPYVFNVALLHDASGNIMGVNSDYAGPLNILQNFWEAGVTSDSGYNSGTAEVQ